MKKCTHCKINVGGTLKVCPLCQSKLSGGSENDEPHFPSTDYLKNVSTLLRLFVFLVIAGSAVSYVLDSQVLKFEHFNFSRPIHVYAGITLFSMYVFYKDHKSVPKILVMAMVIISCALAYTGVTFGCMELMVWYIVPILFTITVVANVIFCFFNDKLSQDSIICILVNILLGVITEIYFIIRNIPMPLCWGIAKIVSTITVIALVVFQGGKLYFELKKRLSI